jgi:hypothetical protein
MRKLTYENQKRLHYIQSTYLKNYSIEKGYISLVRLPVSRAMGKIVQLNAPI